MMKRIMHVFRMVSVTLLVLIALPMTAQYTLSDNDVVVEEGVIVSCSYDFSLKEIIIPETLDGQKVTGIQDGRSYSGAFLSKGITSLKLPSGIEFIGEYAFNNNDIVTLDLSLCVNLKDIRKYAFGNNELASVNLNSCSSLERIDENAFYRNKLSSASINLCNSLRMLSGMAFAGNSLLTGIELPENTAFPMLKWRFSEGQEFAAGSVINSFYGTYRIPIQYTLTDDDVEVVDGVLESCSYDYEYTDIVIPNTLDGQTIVSIGKESTSGPFRNKNITSVILPANLEVIGRNTFDLNKIDSVDFTKCIKLKSIKRAAFSGNKLHYVDLTKCVDLEIIYELAFYNNAISGGVVLPVNSSFVELGWKDDTGNSYVGGDVVADYNLTYRVPIPYTLTDDDVEMLDGYIQSCSYSFELTDIIIPETLDGQTVKGIYSASSYSKSVFYGKKITSVVLPSGMEEIGSCAFQRNNITSLDFSGFTSLKHIGDRAFYENMISEVDFSACTALKKIGNSAFHSNKLVDLDMSECTSLNWIAENAFVSNYSFNGVKLPVNSDPDFMGWQGANGELYNGGDIAPKIAYWLRAVIPYTLKDEDVVVSDGIIESCSYDFSASRLIIPDVLDGQEVRGFAEAVYDNGYRGVFIGKGLLSVVFPAHLDTIASYDFSINLLSEVDFSACTSLSYIGERAFEENRIEALDLSTCISLKEIDDRAFMKSKIATLNLRNCDVLQRIGEYAFQDNEIETLDLSDCVKLEEVCAGSFWGNDLSELDLSPCSSLYFVGNGAFSGNSFSQMVLPVLGLPGFLGWRDANGNTYAGGTSVSNFFTDYTAMASYILKDEDVLVENGVIKECYYEFRFTDIIIPDELDGQVVTGIAERGRRENGNYGGVFESKKITTIVLPSGIDTIGSSAFASNKIKKLDMQNSSIEVIGAGAFGGCLIDTLLLANSNKLKKIEHSAFANNFLYLVDLENCNLLDTLKNNVFSSYGTIDSVNLEGCASLVYIYENAFGERNANLQVKIPQSTLGESYGWVDGNNNSYENGDVISDLSILYRVPVVYTLQDDDVEVENGSIESCSYDFSYTDIVIPETLDGQEITCISRNSYSGTFSRKGITSVVFPSTIDSVGRVAFLENEIVSLDFSSCNPTYIGLSAFKENLINEVNFGNCTNLTFIDENAFEENRIEQLDLSSCSSLLEIADNAFKENSITNIDFTNCNNLGRIGQSAFRQNRLTSLDLSLCPLIQVLENGAFMYNRIAEMDFSECDHLTYLGGYLFDRNDFSAFKLPAHFESSLNWIDEEDNTYAQLQEVTDLKKSYRLPIVYTLSDDDVAVESGEIISTSYPFYFTDIKIPESLNGQTITGIGSGVVGLMGTTGIFKSKGITSLQLPASIEFIGDGSFSGNTLDSLDISVCNNLTEIGKSAFSNNGISKLKWNSGIEKLGSSAFSFNDISDLDLSALTHLVYIGSKAFYRNEAPYILLPVLDIAGFEYWSGVDEQVFYSTSPVYNFSSYFIAVFEGENASNVRFRVTDGTLPIEDAEVLFNGQILYTDSDGELLFVGVLNGSYEYTITAEGYRDVSGILSLNGDDIVKEVAMSVVTGAENRELSVARVYPNPYSSGPLHVQLVSEDWIEKVELIDMSGRTVFEGDSFIGSEGIFSPNDCKPGIYIVKINTLSGTLFQQKMIIK